MDTRDDGKMNRGDIEFNRKKHVKYFERILDGVPGAFGSQETNLITVVYFCVSGLDLLQASDVLKKRKDGLISYVYSLQKKSATSGQAVAFFGNLSDVSLNSASASHSGGFQVGPSIATTFAALCVLLILGDDLAGVDRPGMAQFLKSLQLPDGSFHVIIPLRKNSENSGLNSSSDESEADMRFVFCACAISYIIADWNGVDVGRTVDFISKSRTYEGGFAQCPGAECHGGSTYCAVAAAKLIYLAERQAGCSDSCHEFLGALLQSGDAEKWSAVRDSLVRWCVFRQIRGFTGRPNKPEDSCYTFWLGATLKLLEAYEFVNEDFLEDFCLETQDTIIGGFAKWPDIRSDPMHSYLCIGGLSLMNGQHEDSKDEIFGFDSASEKVESPVETLPESTPLKPVNPALNISTIAVENFLRRTRPTH